MQSTFRHLLSINSVKLSGARLEHQQLLTASHKTPRNVEQHLFLGLSHCTIFPMNRLGREYTVYEKRIWRLFCPHWWGVSDTNKALLGPHYCCTKSINNLTCHRQRSIVTRLGVKVIQCSFYSSWCCTTIINVLLLYISSLVAVLQGVAA